MPAVDAVFLVGVLTGAALVVTVQYLARVWRRNIGRSGR
jgi:hypothetical protein